MSHDSDYFRRRAAEARAAACSKVDADTAEMAGDLALAYAALARGREQDSDPQSKFATPALELGA